MNQHLIDRFFQRYGFVLTSDILNDLRNLAIRSNNRMPDRDRPGREHVWVYWNGTEVGIAWDPSRRFFFTFIPSRMGRLAWTLPKRKKRRW